MNIFNNVVRNEVQFTELFRNLCEYKLFRKIVTDWMYEKLVNPKNIDRQKLDFNADEVETQFSIDGSSGDIENGRSRPDLLINNGIGTILMEFKVTPYCELTPNQPEKYFTWLEKLANQEYKLLLFIVPRLYKNQSFIENWFEKKNKDKKVLWKILHWEDLSTRIRESGLCEINSLFQQFVDLCEEWFPNKTISLSEKNLENLKDKTIGAAIQEAHKMVDAVRESLALCSEIKLSPKKCHEYDYAFTIKSQTGQNIGYFGFAYYDWEDESHSPFLIGVPEKRRMVIGNETHAFQDLDYQYKEDELHYYGIKRMFFSNDFSIETITNLVIRTIGIQGKGATKPKEEVSFLLSENKTKIIKTWFDNRLPAVTFNTVVDALMQTRTLIQNRYDKIRITPKSSIDELSIISESEEGKFYIGLFLWDWIEKGISLWAGFPEKTSLKEEIQKRLDKADEYPERGWKYQPIKISHQDAQADLVEYLTTITESLIETTKKK